MTKTEELLKEAKVRMRSGSVLFDELSDHLAPLIAKERIIAKLRDYEVGSDSRGWTIIEYNNKIDSFVLDCPHRGKTVGDPNMYSSKESWQQVINEMPEDILTAFGWGGI